MLLFPLLAASQIVTREDSLSAGLSMSNKNTIISGYGEAKVVYDAEMQTATANLTRVVLFVGYRLQQNITLFTEMEVEDAKVAGGNGELAMEQCVLKFDLHRNHYLLAGLIIPRIGIMNENHLPTTFHSNDRHLTERFILPSTWREIGIGYYGSSDAITGLNWSFSVMNGLNGEEISGSSGLRDARYEGSHASASNIAISASVLQYIGSFRLQASGYYGGSIGLSPAVADTLGLNTGLFGTPVGLAEFNLQYRKKGVTLKGLVTGVQIPQAQELNNAFDHNAPRAMYGYYLEAAYNILETRKKNDHQLDLFARYESMDRTASLPENGVDEATDRMSFLYLGFSYFPSKNVAIKFDWKKMTTGTPKLLILPDAASGEQLSNSFLQLGLAYSF